MQRNDGAQRVLAALMIILLSIASIASYTGMTNQSTTVVSEPEKREILDAGIPHGPIDINGDADFNTTAQAEGWPGNGTLEKPYVIEGLDINLGYAPGDCIRISNTRVHFIISNCSLSYAGGGLGTGIKLNNVANGTIINNFGYHSTYFIYLDGSNSNTLYNNTSNNGAWGGYGVYLFNSNYNNVTSSFFSGYIGIELEQSSFNIVDDNDCSNNYDGIYLLVSSSNIITNNNVTYSEEFGLWISSSNSNTVVDNIISHNYQTGIYIDASSSSILTNNTCTNNQFYGIMVNTPAVDNEITWNVFADNSLNGRDMGSGNLFDYNYWSDYLGNDSDLNGFGDTPYVFSGNNDTHPLIYLPTPPKWIEIPSDKTIEFGASIFRYKLNVTCPSPVEWFVNNTLFAVDNLGVVTSRTILPIDTYKLSVVVTNIYDSTLQTSFQVNVLDTTQPGWLIIPTNQILEYNEEFDYQIVAIDESGIDHWELNDTTHFSLTASYFAIGSTARIINSTLLDSGVYSINVSVFDIYGNGLSAVVTLTIKSLKQDALAPIWIVIPIDEYVIQGDPFLQRVGAWDSSGIDHWWLNDTNHFTLDGHGVIRNATSLIAGRYAIEIRAYDPYDNFCSAVIVLTVLESTRTTQPPDESALVIVAGVGISGVVVIASVLMFLKKRQSK